MNLSWIIAGVVLLLGALVLRKLNQSGTFQTLVATFVLLWSAMAALHWWPASYGAVERLGLMNLSEGQEALAAYWSGFAVAALPSLLLIYLWLRAYTTAFPPIVAGLVQAVGSTCCVIGTVALVLMSLALAAPESAEPTTPIRRLYAGFGRMPIRTYLCLAAQTAGAENTMARVERLPRPARLLLANAETRANK